jgi:hypothetical protein
MLNSTPRKDSLLDWSSFCTFGGKTIRMKRVFTFSLVLLLSAGAQAQQVEAANATANTPAVAPAPADDVLVLTEEVYDFGKIPQGKPVTHVFNVANGGKQAFKIDNVQASCGCTTPEWDREKTLNPGDKSSITVGYNAAAEGPFTKYITVMYNGSQSKMITIKGEVWKTPAASAPEKKELGGLKD